MTTLLTLAASAIALSAFCSLLLSVLSSVTPSYIAELLDRDPARGQVLKALKVHHDRPIAAILALQTLALTLGAALCGAQAARLGGATWLAIFVALFALSAFFFAGILPKSLGEKHWKKLIPLTVQSVRVLVVFLFPLAWIGEQIARFFRGGKHEESAVSKEEIAALARLGEEGGALDASETRILSNLFRFSALKVRDIMTPRTVMFALKSGTKVRDLVPKFGIPHETLQQNGHTSKPASESGEAAQTSARSEESKRNATMVFSRIPVYGNSPDDVRGFVLKSDIFLRAAQDQLDLPIDALVRKILVVHDTLQVASLFDRFLESREQIALVVDEYGGVDGIVTMEDVIETLLGLEIMDEVDRVEDMRDMARKRWTKRREELGSVPPPPREFTGPFTREAAASVAPQDEGAPRAERHAEVSQTTEHV